MSSLSQVKYSTPDHLSRFVGEQVPRDARLMAARGMLPLPPADLLHTLFVLSRDPDQEIANTASQSLVRMPENILKTILGDKQTHPLILDFAARNLDSASPLHDVIALNPGAHDDTIVFQASLLRKELVDIISQNQTRILRRPDIVDVLAENMMMGQAQLERILKFLELEEKRAAKKAPVKPAVEVDIEELEEEEEEVSAVTEPGEDEEVAAVTDAASAWSRMTFDQDLLTDHKTETEEEEEDLETNLYKKIGSMPVSKKIKLALMGGAQARSILIKDSNKMVSASVLKSPRITESEIEGISRSKAVSDELIRMISGNREWTKSYQVKLNLVQNPKCPLSESMRLMNHLRDKDLRDLARSRNIPSQVAAQAKRLLARKEEKSKPGAKR